MKSRVWHGTLALIVLASLITQIVLTTTDSAPHAGPPVHETTVTRFVRLFSYFTIQSNLLVLIAIVGLARDPARDGRVWRVIRLDALLGWLLFGPRLRIDARTLAWAALWPAL